MISMVNMKVEFIWFRRYINKYIGTRPWLFSFVMSRRKKFKNIIVNKCTEIVIEGFPRSANTFAVAAFVYSQPKKYIIARHTHAPAQVMLGVKAGLPVILLVRKPLDAVVSLVIREENISLKHALKKYIWYHKSILSIVQNCVVADFEQVVGDFSNIISDINDKFDEKYLSFDHNKKSEVEIFKLVEEMEIKDSGGVLRETHVARPSKSRAGVKNDLKNKLESPDYSYLLDECYRLYNTIIES